MKSSFSERLSGSDSGVSREAREQYLPLINRRESRFIEDVGGEFEGFVERDDGGQRFEDLQVDHRAFYDSSRRAIIEALVTTEAVNHEGTDELSNKSEVQGYSAMIVFRSRAGEELERPRIVHIGSRGKNHQDAEVNRLQTIARDAHRFLIDNASVLSPDELEGRARALVDERLARREEAR